MLVSCQIKIQYKLIWFLFICFGCIQKNESNPSVILTLARQNLFTNPIQVIPSLRACLVTRQIPTGKITTCFETTIENCNLTFFNNIPTNQILQNRKDDLNFININFPNCTAGATPLSIQYSNLVPPTGMFFKKLLDINGPNLENQIRFTNQESCKILGLEVSEFVSVNFERIVNSDELKQLDSLEAELALIPTTTSNCFTDLNYNQSLITLTNKIRTGVLQTGITCAYQTGVEFPLCPWSL
ncbi:LA_1694 family PerA/PerB upregulated protein [Leptospira brenneri]|uniref:Uncharacterized protein n=1 Tax=Leptospira brenneri TaxID=2023182 RepID=A0A2M9Y6I6_9LEPT|nr:hypothetical protein [Leptospira brenneri]PJZ47198.1 hypothetical protein CH361_02320 [Leptospira brenneri]TGK95841.1 hypothetical protein EHQ30_04215 [Leptospira brenneri]